MSKFLRNKKFLISRWKEATDYIKENNYVSWGELQSSLCMRKSTLQRVLKDTELCVSLNSKRQFFTLRSIILERKDSSSCLWKVNGKVFSSVGGLKETILFLIRFAPNGIDEKTLTETLETPARNILAQLKQKGKIKATAFEGRNVYFSQEEKRYYKQLQRRLALERCEEIQISFEEFLETIDPEIHEIARDIIPREVQDKTNPAELIKLILTQPKLAHTSDRHMSRLLRNNKRIKNMIHTEFTGHSAISKYKDLLTVEFYVRMFEFFVEKVVACSGLKEATILVDCSVNERYKRDSTHYRTHTATIAELKCPVALIITQGKVHESPIFERILSKLEKLKVKIKYVICDAGYDSGKIFVRVGQRLKAIAVIPTRDFKKSIFDQDLIQLTLDYYFEEIYRREILELTKGEEKKSGSIIRELVDHVKKLDWWKNIYKMRTGVERFFGWVKMFLGLTKPNGYSLKQVARHAYQIFSFTVAQTLCALKLGIETKTASYRSFIV